MDATKIMILDQYSTSRPLNTKGIPRTIPSNYEHALQCPPVFDIEFRVELAVGVSEFIDSINPFAADGASAALQQEPAEVVWNWRERGFKSDQFGYGRDGILAPVRQCSENVGNLFAFQFVHATRTMSLATERIVIYPNWNGGIDYALNCVASQGFHWTSYLS